MDHIIRQIKTTMNNVTEQVLPIYKPITLNLIADPNTFEFIPGQTYHFSLRRIPPPPYSYIGSFISKDEINNMLLFDKMFKTVNDGKKPILLNVSPFKAPIFEFNFYEEYGKYTPNVSSINVSKLRGGMRRRKTRKTRKTKKTRRLSKT